MSSLTKVTHDENTFTITIDKKDKSIIKAMFVDVFLKNGVFIYNQADVLDKINKCKTYEACEDIKKIINDERKFILDYIETYDDVSKAYILSDTKETDETIDGAAEAACCRDEEIKETEETEETGDSAAEAAFCRDEETEETGDGAAKAACCRDEESDEIEETEESDDGTAEAACCRDEETLEIYRQTRKHLKINKEMLEIDRKIREHLKMNKEISKVLFAKQAIVKKK